MYELELTDVKGNPVGTFRTEEYTEALTLFRDFLQMKFSVILRDKEGAVIKEQTVLQ